MTCNEYQTIAFMKNALFNNLTWGHLRIINARAELLGRWLRRAKDLDSNESTLKNSLEPGVRDVLSGKRILLLKSIARDLNWPDRAFFDELLEGF